MKRLLYLIALLASFALLTGFGPLLKGQKVTSRGTSTGLRISAVDGTSFLDGPGVACAPFLPAVKMTYASSGSSGITVADNDNIDFGTGDFTLVWRGSLPNWTPSSAKSLIRNRISAGFIFGLDTNAKLFLQYQGVVVYSSIVTSISDNSVASIVMVADRDVGTYFYVNGALLGTVATASVLDVSEAAVLYVSGSNAIRTASTTHFAATYNRALTAAEVLDLYNNGIAASDQWGSQTAQTSGTLTVGKRYRINDWITDDDFTNVGGTNEDGNEFIATGTTPTTWTNSSAVVPIGATLALEPSGIGASDWQDSSSNNLDAAYPATGWEVYDPLDGNHTVEVYDASGRMLRGFLKSQGAGETGSELLASVGTWTNGPTSIYETFSQTGLDITSAINTVGYGTAYIDVTSSVALGLYKFTGTMTVSSGLNQIDFNNAAESGGGNRNYFDDVTTSGDYVSYRTATSASRRYIGFLSYVGLGAGFSACASPTFTRITTPSTSGAVIVSTKGGAVENWFYKNPSFTYNQAAYTVIVKAAR